MKVKEKAHKDHESGAESSEDLPISTIEANTPRTRKSSSREVSAKRRKLDPTSSEEDDEDLDSDQQEKMVLRPRPSISKKAGDAKDRSSNDSTSNKPTPARKNMKSSGQAKKKKKSKSVRGSKHECDSCKKPFACPDVLERHMQTHTGEKPFKCDMCGKQFSLSGNLTTHLLVHSGEKPYGCKYCGKKFSGTGNLTIHSRLHTGEKPYECEYCGKKFSDPGNLTQHSRLHTGEKPFQCNFCDKKFVQSSNLKSHIMFNHTHEKPWKCSRCSKKFVRWDQLKRHLKTHKILNPCRESFKNTDVNAKGVRKISKKPVDVVSVTKKLSSLQVNDSADDSSRTASNDISGGSELSDAAQIAANSNQPSTSKTSIEVQRNAPDVDEQEDQELQSARDTTADEDSNDASYEVSEPNGSYEEDLNVDNFADFGMDTGAHKSQLKDVSAEAASTLFPSNDDDNNVNKQPNISINVQKEVIRSPLSMDGTENMSHDNNNELEVASERYSQVDGPDDNTSIRSGYIHQHPSNILNVYSSSDRQSMDTLQDVEERASSIVDDLNFDESSGELLEHANIFETRKRDAVIQQEDNISVHNGPVVRTRVNATENASRDDIADVKEEPESEGYQEFSEYNGSLRSGPIYRGPLNVSSRSSFIVEDDQQSVCAPADESNVDELSDESTKHGNHSFESGPINRVVKEEDNMSFVSGPVDRNDYNDDFNAENSRSTFDDATGEENGNGASLSSSDDEVDNQIIYANCSTERIIEKYAERNVDTLFVVWIEKFVLSVASAVAANSNNCMLIVEKCGSMEFNPNCFPQSVLIDKIIVGNDEMCCFRFGRQLSVHTETYLFADLERLEHGLASFACCHNKSLVHIIDQDCNSLIKKFTRPIMVSVSSRSSFIVEDDQQSVCAPADESNVDELSDESTKHGNHSFESGPINRVVKEEDNMSFVSGPVDRNDYNDDFNAESGNDSRSTFDDATGEENGNGASLSSSDDEVDNQIIYANCSTERIIEKYAERNVDTLFVVWIEKFVLSVASAVAANSNNCMLIVEKCGSMEFNPNCFPQSVLIDKIIVGNDEMCCFRFGRQLSVHTETYLFADLERLEHGLASFACCHNKSLVHIIDQDCNSLIKKFTRPIIVSGKIV